MIEYYRVVSEVVVLYIAQHSASRRVTPNITTPHHITSHHITSHHITSHHMIEYYRVVSKVVVA